MKDYGLENIPSLVEKKSLTEKEALNWLSVFILENKPLFGLQKFTEDFCSEIIIKFLENGKNFMESFDFTKGSFASFFYCYILSLIQTQKKQNAKKILEQTIYTAESKVDYEESEEKYEMIAINKKEYKSIPYNFTPISLKELQKIFINKTTKADKKILVLAIKSALFLTDQQIENICKMYNLEPVEMLSAIQYCKDSLKHKIQHRDMVIERRNKAYYFHKKYEEQISKINEVDSTDNQKILQEELSKKDEKHSKSWELINSKLTEGYLYLRPTNKTVAEIIGICERQVGYYLYCVKHNDISE